MDASNTSPGSSGSRPGDFVAPSVKELGGAIPSYDFLEVLGQGGMGAVYLARHLTLDRLVAIKIIKKSLVAEPLPLSWP